VPSRIFNGQSPFHYLARFFPDLNLHTHLPIKVFGCVCFVHILKIHRDKLDPRALKCIFIRYSPTQKGYKCYHSITQKFYKFKDVTFSESQPYFTPIPYRPDVIGQANMDWEFLNPSLETVTSS